MSSERQEEIRFLLQEYGHLTVTELSQRLNVSEMTIRRDLKNLASMGLILREHGKALYPQNQLNSEVSFLTRLGEAEREKTRIARAALEIINDGDSIILDAGTTTLALAQILNKQVVAITNSLPIATVLGSKEKVTTLLTGGEVRGSTFALVGPMTRMNFSGFNADKLFLGATGVSLDKGLSTTNMMESEVKQAMIKSAKSVILLAHSSKLGQVYYHTFANWDSVNTLVTDSKISKDTVLQFNKLGIKVIIAE